MGGERAGTPTTGREPAVFATAFGIAPQTLVYSYLRDRAPEYVWLLFVVSSLVVVGMLIAVLRYRRRGLVESKRRVR